MRAWWTWCAATAIIYTGAAADKGVAFDVVEVPADLKDKYDELRKVMLEAVVEEDETLMEKYLNGEELTVDEIMLGIRKATISMKICPVLCGTAFRNKGVQSPARRHHRLHALAAGHPRHGGHQPGQRGREDRVPLRRPPSRWPRWPSSS